MQLQKETARKDSLHRLVRILVTDGLGHVVACRQLHVASAVGAFGLIVVEGPAAFFAFDQFHKLIGLRIKKG